MLPFPFRTYNWGPLWHELRGRVPESADFRSGTTVSAVEVTPDGVELATGSGSERFDVVIGADGYRSAVRTAACPEVRPRYAGYLAWRGAFAADRLMAPELWPDEDCVYAVFPGGHVIIYRIPDGRGGLRVNWVLYTAPPPDLDLRFDNPTSLPPGTLAATLHIRLAHIADTQLAPYWGQLVRTTTADELFVQPMYDFTAPHYATGRLVLAGDAATVARPHTGGGAVKALQDATALEACLTSTPDWEAALHAYDSGRAATGRSMVELGRRPRHRPRGADAGLERDGPERPGEVVATGGRLGRVRRAPTQLVAVHPPMTTVRWAEKSPHFPSGSWARSLTL